MYLIISDSCLVFGYSTLEKQNNVLFHFVDLSLRIIIVF